jgi:hypothetical protein
MYKPRNGIPCAATGGFTLCSGNVRDHARQVW